MSPKRKYPLINNELPRNPQQFIVSWNYLLLFSLITGVVIISLSPCGSNGGPEDVVLVLVAAPVWVWSGTSASAVLSEGGGGIDLPDEIYVINVGGYIGESTRSEIEYAKKNGRGVRYLE